MPRPDQMNINVATWGRLLKKNINLKNVSDQSRTENEQNSGRNCREFIKRTIKFWDNFWYRIFWTEVLEESIMITHGCIILHSVLKLWVWNVRVCVSCSEMSSLKISFWQQTELHSIFTFTFIKLKHQKRWAYTTLWCIIKQQILVGILFGLKNLTTMIFISLLKRLINHHTIRLGVYF